LFAGSYPVTLVIKNDGTMLWNGVRLSSDADLAEITRPYGASGQRIPVHVRVGQRATYDAVAKALATLQRSGCCSIGIVAK
jgi:biopolymer transport protein ExbD